MICRLPNGLLFELACFISKEKKRKLYNGLRCLWLDLLSDCRTLASPARAAGEAGKARGLHCKPRDWCACQMQALVGWRLE